MLHLAFTGGLRVSELVGLKVGDATFRAGYIDIRVMGKGRKQRALTLWKTVARSLRAWLSIRGDASALNCSSMRVRNPSLDLASSTFLKNTSPLPLRNVRH
jgi:site-specific recombinase XerC